MDFHPLGHFRTAGTASKRRIVLFLLVAGLGGKLFGVPPVTELFLSGSWELLGKLQNRADIDVYLPGAGLDFRLQALDKRPATPPLLFKEGQTSPGGGIYHRATGSRLVYGLLDEWGLPARIRNPWIRALPLAELHAPLAADLRTGIVSSRDPAAHLYLGTPALGPWTAFVSAQTDRIALPDFGAGITGSFRGKRIFRMEGFYTEKTLEVYKPSAWFSEKPPLPERDFRLKAISLYYTSPLFGIALDGAHSETFAYGEGAYGNIGLRFGNRPWRLSLAADAAAGRYVGRDGSVPGKGFRAGAVAERRGKGGGLFKAGTTLEADAPGAAFSKSASSLYLRFPRSGDRSFWPSRVSLTFKRNEAADEKALDSSALSFGLLLGPFSADLSGGVKWRSSRSALPYPDFRNLDEMSVFTAGGKVLLHIERITLQTAVNYYSEKDKDPYADASFSAILNFGKGRLRGSFAYLGKKGNWNAGLSWQLRQRWRASQ